MKISELAKKYKVDPNALEKVVLKHPEIKASGIVNISVRDQDEEKIMELYRLHFPSEATLEAKIKKEKEINDAISKMLVSSGFSFEGYKITKYSGYISGDDAVQVNRYEIFDNNGQNLTDALVKIRIQALKELKIAAYELGCNAVIGVDFDYLTFEPETANFRGGTTYQPYIICVTANGNAVVVEKEN